MRLMVSPRALSVAMEQSTASGMERAMMTVLRQEPIKSKIISAVRAAAISPSFKTPLMAALTKTD